MATRPNPGHETIELPFIFVPDGAPMPEAARHFRDPIVLRARFEPEPPSPNVAPAQRAAPRAHGTDSVAPRDLQQAGTTPGQVSPSLTTQPVKLIGAGGGLIAWATAGELLAEASWLAAAEAALPVIVAVAGTAIAFHAVSSLLEYLAQMSGDRNAGLPGPLRNRSERARASARAADPAVVDELDQDEWRAHHFIGINGARDHTRLLETAARAGWVMDEPDNVIALPLTFAAQQKLARAGIHRPVHDNGHPFWNRDVHRELSDIEKHLSEVSLDERSEQYAVLARRLLEALQMRLRQKALEMQRITRNDQGLAHPDMVT